jgi:hypothetical protein|tara:strand:+ start:355 stop:489 length:135 start_codon:yes stop_codon:yes gene_type:complete
MTTIELINKRILKATREGFLLIGFLIMILQIQVGALVYLISKLN